MIAALAGLVAGDALQLQQAALWPLAAYLACLGAAVALWSLSRMGRVRSLQRANRSGPWLRAPTGLMAAALFAFGLAGWRAVSYQSGALLPALEGRDVLVTGVVAAMPQRGEAGLRFRFAVESARLLGPGAKHRDGQVDAQDSAREVTLPPALYLGWYSGSWTVANAQGLEAEEALRPPADLRAGERWQMAVRLKAPHGASNPHGFDYELWLWEQGLQASGYVRGGPRDPRPQRIGLTWQHPVERARQAVRDAIEARVPDRRVSGVIAALLVGDQNAIERADWDVFRATGVAHLMSISGLHITMFAWMATLAAGWLWRRSARLCLAVPASSAALAAGVLLATLYAVFSGWGVPSQRTVCMLATVALLRLSGRLWPWPHVWLLAMAVVTLADPWAMPQAGFWLSFVAVGVLFASDAGKEAAPAHAEPAPRDDDAANRLPGKTLAARGLDGLRTLAGHAAKGLREQWVVTLALTPLCLLLFQQVSLVGLAANALAIPWVTLVVTPLCMLGAFVAPLWDLAAWAVRVLLWWLQFLAALPLASISAPAPALWAAIAGVGGGLLLAMRLPWHLRLLGVPLLLPVLLWQAPRPPPGEFELIAADVGQGNAVLVRTAGHALLYDSGPRYGPESDAGSRMLVPLLRALGERLDTVMLSHRDSDHTGGAPAVLAMQPQAALVSSVEATHPLQALRAATRCAQGQRWEWDGVRFEVLHPREEDYASAQRPNAMSCVLRIASASGAGTALLAGDIEQPQEERLVAALGDALRADVLLVPHHGSKTSSSPAFLDAARPRLALVQAGYRNRFGHPAAPVLARYEERGIRVLASPRCGAARWSSLQPGAAQCQRQEAARYWQHQPP